MEAHLKAIKKALIEFEEVERLIQEDPTPKFQELYSQKWCEFSCLVALQEQRVNSHDYVPDAIQSLVREGTLVKTNMGYCFPDESHIIELALSVLGF